MRRLALLFLCWLLPLAAPAAVYKWVDEEGNVVYSDKPHAGAKKLDLPPPTVYSPPSTASEAKVAPKKEKEDSVGYRVLIVSPRQDETIRDNTGAVTVQMVLEPSLNAEAGHQLALLLDGIKQPGNSISSLLQLQNVGRGSHTVQIQVEDAEGKPLASSNVVTFHMKQASRLLRPKSGPPVGGVPTFPPQSNPPPADGAPTPP